MSENEQRNANGAGDDESTVVKVTGSEAGVERDVLVTKEAALECARSLFLAREGGPHRSGAPTVAELPTRDEVLIGQAALKEVLGDKGSEKRAAANALSARGLIDLEEGLGYLLADRFVGQLPADEERARGVGKRAADKLPTKKEKEKWREKGRQARQAAEKRGESAEAVAAAGAQAKVDSERRFLRKLIDPDFQKAGLAAATPAAPAPTAPAPAPAASPVAPPDVQRQCEHCTGPCCCVALPARARSNVEMAQSQEAAAAIDAAYEVMDHGLRGKDPYFNIDLEIVQVRFKHALRDLRRSYPGQFCGIAESDHNAIIGWTVRLAAFGISIPAAVAAARRVNFNMAGAVAEVAPQIEAARAAQEGRICA